MGQQEKVLAVKIPALWVERTSYRLRAHLSLSLVSCPPNRNAHPWCALRLLRREPRSQSCCYCGTPLASRLTQGQMPG